jgi:hypothetical protein
MTMQPKSPPASSDSAASDNVQEERLRALERAIAAAERRLQRLDASIETSRSRHQVLSQQARRTALLLSELATFLQVVPSDCLDKLLPGVEQPAAAERVERSRKTSAKPSAATRRAPKKSRSKPKKTTSKHFGSTRRPRKAGKR